MLTFLRRLVLSDDVLVKDVPQLSVAHRDSFGDDVVVVAQHEVGAVTLTVEDGAVLGAAVLDPTTARALAVSLVQAAALVEDVARG